MPVRWQEVTAAFGGTFDPPHLGHQNAVRGLFEAPGVQRVLVLPSPVPPHKPSVATVEQRTEMARLAFAKSAYPAFAEGVSLDLRELARPLGRPSYTYDTLMELRRESPRLAFVIGTDQLEKISTWYRFPEVLTLSNWIVLERKPEGQAEAARGLSHLTGSGILRPSDAQEWQTATGTVLKLVSTQAPRLSSTSIREAIALTGQPPENSLPPAVLAYLKLHRIYGTRDPEIGKGT